MLSNPLFISYWTITRKEITRFLRVWSQTLVPPIITTTLYYVIFWQFIGPKLGTIDGRSYMEFIVPGLVMMAVITSSFMNTVSSFYMAKFQKNIEELLVSPTPYSIIITGYITGWVIRWLLTGALVLFVAFFFTHISFAHPILTLVFALVTALLFSLIGLLNGLLANSFDGMSIIPNFVLTPLTYLGGVFYSVSMLPPFWQMVSKGNPILYMIDGFRYAMHGTSDISPYVSLAMISLFCLVFFIINFQIFKKGKWIRS